ncbi:MAG: hypothetical protein ACK4S6_18760 [Roseateles asaccharophilus]|jgi:hypothetical protein|uniref:Uncharacterized protein n=1 Tax=Roseateles asaccharophilus TaxID=582607 RepID=A0A4V3CJE7_9BURK|nr:hypothetical protein [Roseateles asaccharophilus]MDN3544154.1 hypothetical protein [Roseateles asaccharophilus]TDP09252.1 hypothetical protein DFR39_10590 [Roseateles asaccharophilus]
MGTIAMTFFLESEFGTEVELPRSGSALEQPLVYDQAARELQGLAARGRLQILQLHESSQNGQTLIDRLSFRRLS